MKKNKNMYYWLGGIAVLLVVAVAAIFSQGALFRGSTSINPIYRTTPPPACIYTYTPWGICSASGFQSRSLDPTYPPVPAGCSGKPVTSQACTPPSIALLPSSVIYQGKNQSMIQFRLTAGSDPIDIKPDTTWGYNMSFFLYTVPNPSAKLSACYLLYPGYSLTGKLFTNPAPAVGFSLPPLTIQPSKSVDFWVICDIADAKTGDMFAMILSKIFNPSSLSNFTLTGPWIKVP